MSPMDHRVWKELEMVFKVKFSETEKSQITDLTCQEFVNNPSMSYDALTQTTFKIVEQVLRQRKQKPLFGNSMVNYK